MKRSIISVKPIVAIVVVLTAVFTISSCSIKGYKAVSNLQEINNTTLHIFNNDFQKALFKTEIIIYDRELTGITLIKKTDSAMRVVAMSEMGMKYFDFEYPINQPNQAIVHYVMQPLNKKLLIKMLKHDFSLIFNLPQVSNSQVLISKYDATKIIIKHKNLNYFVNKYSLVTNIKKQHILRANSSIVTLSGYTKYNPDTIYYDHGKISLKFTSIKN